MMTGLKKNRKKRRHVSGGHGRIGKHPGGMHHHRILFDKYHPGYFGEVGMRRFHKLRNKAHFPTLNVDRVWSLVPESAKEGRDQEGTPLVDVIRFGYLEVLGKGMLPPKCPVVVKAKLVSKTAEKKFKAIGGIRCAKVDVGIQWQLWNGWHQKKKVLIAGCI